MLKKIIPNCYNFQNSLIPNQNNQNFEITLAASIGITVVVGFISITQVAKKFSLQRFVSYSEENIQVICFKSVMKITGEERDPLLLCFHILYREMMLLDQRCFSIYFFLFPILFTSQHLDLLMTFEQLNFMEISSKVLQNQMRPYSTQNYFY